MTLGIDPATIDLIGDPAGLRVLEARLRAEGFHRMAHHAWRDGDRLRHQSRDGGMSLASFAGHVGAVAGWRESSPWHA